MICNHCDIAFKEAPSKIGEGMNAEENAYYEVTQYDCPQCGKPNIYLRIKHFKPQMMSYVMTSERLIYPALESSQQLPTDVPDHFRNDFYEAALVVGISPKASAALSRRLLEGILVENGAPSHKNLFEQITHAVSNGIPSYISDELDYIRKIGKFAAHAKSDRATGEIIDVDKEEAEAMLSIIDLLCDHYYVMPAKATRRHQQLEEKLQASKAKPVEK